MQGILFNQTTMPWPNSWVENPQKLKNTFTTEAGTEIDLIVRAERLSVSVAYVCLDDLLQTLIGFRDMNSFTLTRYDPGTQSSETKTVRMTDFNYELVRKSATLSGQNGVWKVSFNLEEF